MVLGTQRTTKTDDKSYHKAFVVLKILTHNKNSERVDKNNQRI